MDSAEAHGEQQRDGTRHRSGHACLHAAREAGIIKKVQKATASATARAVAQWAEQERADLTGLRGKELLREQKRLLHNREARVQGH
eukprot:284888-Pyramimonas_sp.AAC.1